MSAIDTQVMRPTDEIRKEVAQGRIPMPAARPMPAAPAPGRHRSIEERPTEHISPERVSAYRAVPQPVVVVSASARRSKLAMLVSNLRAGQFRRG